MQCMVRTVTRFRAYLIGVLRGYINFLLQFSLNVFDLYFDFFIGFSLTKGWKKERLDCPGIHSDFVQVVQPLYKPRNQNLKQMVFVHERYITAKNVILNKDFTITSVDNKVIGIRYVDSMATKGYQDQPNTLSTLTQWLIQYDKEVLANIDILDKVMQDLIRSSRMDKIQMLLISTTPGSRSDILVQSLQNVPGTLTISNVEGAFIAFENFFTDKIQQETLERVLVMLILIQVLRAIEDQRRRVSRILLEMPGLEPFDDVVISHMEKIFSKVKRLFFTRSPKDSIKDCQNQMLEDKSTGEDKYNWTRQVSKFMDVNELYSCMLKKYLETKDDCCYDMAVSFEEYAKRPAYVTSQFFRMMDIPIEELTMIFRDEEDHHSDSEDSESHAQKKVGQFEKLDQSLKKMKLPGLEVLNRTSFEDFFSLNLNADTKSEND